MAEWAAKRTTRALCAIEAGGVPVRGVEREMKRDPVVATAEATGGRAGRAGVRHSAPFAFRDPSFVCF